jgi:hypothetical protein
MSLKFNNTKQLVERALELDYFAEDEPAIPFVWKPGKAENPLVVVVGENAGGKSFFRRCVSAVCQDKDNGKVEVIPISMEARRTINYQPWLAFVYGDEQYEATGVNSINTVLSGIKTCQGRDAAHVIIWDEPDIGLSEGNAASVGKAIADFTKEPPKHTKASIVITHRKALVGQLLPIAPHYLYLGDADAPPSLDAWLMAPPVVRPLQEVQDRARTRFKAIQKVLDRVKKSR